MKKYIYSILAIFIVLLLSWATGFNFDERGSKMFTTIYFALSAGIGTFVFCNIAED